MVESAQGTAIRFPVIAIEEIPLDKKIKQALQKRTDYLIFISANAVRLGLPVLQRVAPKQLGHSQIIAIGQATAKQLEEMNYFPHLVPPSPYNSEALLALPEMQKIQDLRIVVMKGKGGRAYLMEQLRHRGATAVGVDIYERLKPEIDNAPLDELIKSDKIVVSVTSVKGLHYLFEMASDAQSNWLKANAHFLVPGERVAEAVKDMHIKQPPWIAENATDPVMFDALCEITN